MTLQSSGQISMQDLETEFDLHFGPSAYEMLSFYSPFSDPFIGSIPVLLMENSVPTQDIQLEDFYEASRATGLINVGKFTDGDSEEVSYGYGTANANFVTPESSNTDLSAHGSISRTEGIFTTAVVVGLQAIDMPDDFEAVLLSIDFYNTPYSEITSWNTIKIKKGLAGLERTLYRSNATFEHIPGDVGDDCYRWRWAETNPSTNVVQAVIDDFKSAHTNTVQMYFKVI
jgi:hypothetical protein